MKEVSIVIPIYKSTLTANEEKSLKQCCEILCKYDIIFVTYLDNDITNYIDIVKNYDIGYIRINFDKYYFNDIAGYNKLMLSSHFYESFNEYRYILIYQLDAFVFRDELQEWCSKSFDYIGAPLIGNFKDKKFSLNMRVGNGGFSLRRVETFINFYKYKGNIFSSKQIIDRLKVWRKPQTRIFLWLLMLVGWRNKSLYLAKNWKYNEDDFWSGLLDNSRYKLSKPQPTEALAFAFERFPKDCFDIVQKIPFGCHAWEKYQYNEFWKKYI